MTWQGDEHIFGGPPGDAPLTQQQIDDLDFHIRFCTATAMTPEMMEHPAMKWCINPGNVTAVDFDRLGVADGATKAEKDGNGKER